jgi:PAS domain S-box-containing protein
VVLGSSNGAIEVSHSVRGADGLAGLWPALYRSPDAIYVTDRQNRIVCWNRSAEHLLGYTTEEALGAPCAGMQGSDEQGNRYCFDVCPVAQLAARGESVRRFMLSLRAKDGTAVPLETSFLTLVVEPPDDFYVVHVLRPPRPTAPRGTAPEAPPSAPQPIVAARQSVDARARRLTPREVEVLGMLAAGRATPEIAHRLHISTLTARNHVQNLLDKLEVHSKAEAVAFAFQKHLI